MSFDFLKSIRFNRARKKWLVGLFVLILVWFGFGSGILRDNQTSLAPTVKSLPEPSHAAGDLHPFILSTNYLFNFSHYYQYTVYSDQGTILAGQTYTPDSTTMLVMVDSIDINQILWNITRSNFGYSYGLGLSSSQKSIYWLISNFTANKYYPVLFKVSLENGSIEWASEIDRELHQSSFVPKLWVTGNPNQEVLISFNSPNDANNSLIEANIYCINASGSLLYNYTLWSEGQSWFATDLVYDPLTKYTAVSVYIVNENFEGSSTIFFYSGQNRNHEITWKADYSRNEPSVQYTIRALALVIEPNEINKLLPVNSFRSRLFAIMTNRIPNELIYNIYIAAIPIYEQSFLSILDLNKISPRLVYTGALLWFDFETHVTKSRHYLAFDFNSIFILAQTSLFNATILQTSCDTLEVIKNYTLNAQTEGFERLMYPTIHFDLDNRMCLLAGLKRTGENYYNSLIMIYSPNYYDPFASLEPTPFYIWAILPLMFVPLFLFKKHEQ